MKDELLKDLQKTYQDGEGDRPTLYKSYGNAIGFARSLPDAFPFPETGSEPDCHITFDWHHSEYNTLSVSIGPNNELTWAALLGEFKYKGSGVFDGTIPAVVLQLAVEIELLKYLT